MDCIRQGNLDKQGAAYRATTLSVVVLDPASLFYCPGAGCLYIGKPASLLLRSRLASYSFCPS